ncbi:uncharacterized protein [Pyrus communis]|uniref:uncharacterized protein n=1 Tax=Pyrus communis TaxID=23211 RepID=UPI0035C20BE2
MEGQSSEPAVMATKARDPSNRTNRGGSKNKSGQPIIGQPSRDCPQGKCLYCGMMRHSKSPCFELIGYPKNWDKTCDPCFNKPQASIAETNDDLEDVASKTSALIVAASIDGKALNFSNYVMNNMWIIDSGAIEHITCDSRHVSSLKNSTDIEVNVANGDAAPGLGEGTISLYDTMKLDTVLVIPSLNYNLLLVA